MVKIDKVYTRGGDEGKTSLGDGTRVSKTDKIIVALANVEELNANLGYIICKLPEEYKDFFRKVQNDLFDFGWETKALQTPLLNGEFFLVLTGGAKPPRPQPLKGFSRGAAALDGQQKKTSRARAAVTVSMGGSGGGAGERCRGERSRVNSK